MEVPDHVPRPRTIKVSDATPSSTLSVVIPLCNEDENVAPLMLELRRALETTGESYEIVFVDDGSRDETWTRVVELAREDARIKGIRLSRNFGHQVALLAGLGSATGQAVISMDGDLQHPPDLIPAMVRAWREGCRVVTTVRDDAESTGFFKRTTSRWFYRLFTLLAGVALSEGSSDFRLLDRRALDGLLQFGPSHLFLRAGVTWLGFSSVSLPYAVRQRRHGQTKYNLRKMRRFAVSAILSYSTRPLLAGIGAGIVTGVAGLAGLGVAVVRQLLGHRVLDAAWILGVLGVLFGVLFLLLGILGAYVGRIHNAVMGRPLYVVSDTLNLPGNA
jgi:dolichol-phosphate mannosyltransferase